MYRARLSLALVMMMTAGLAFAGQTSTERLQIVVLEGEDAVNVVQQQTAVAPVVEVRDRNNEPVAGVAVRFAIRSGRASFNGARAVTVTTDAAGRATAAGLTPTGSGALQITASAAYQGEAAVATIAQTNVMTAAQAAAASSAGAGASAGASSAGTAAGAGTGGSAGGGLSTATLGIVGGAAAGGTLVATQVLSGGPAKYRGAFSITTRSVSQFSQNGQPTLACNVPVTMTGTLAIALADGDGGSVSGELNATWVIEAGTDQQCTTPWRSGDIGQQAPVSGTASSLSAAGSYNDRSEIATGPLDEVQSLAFSGALNGDVITGTLTLTRDSTQSLSTPPFYGFVQQMTGSTGVTLTRE